MLRRRPGRPAALAVLVAAGLGLAGGGAPVPPVGGQEPPVEPEDPTVTTAPIPPPRAAIVVDLDSGQVLLAANEREPVPPASTTKVFTAVLAVQRLGWDGEVTVPPEAVLATPRRLQLQPGEVWGVEGLLYAAMHCSCNDAAWALGHAAGGGTMEGFAAVAGELAAELGLADAPVIRDPAGLDGPRGVDGGNLLSARDLAIAARAYLAHPGLAAIAVAPGHEWVGGDGEAHTVRNLNAFLAHYEGAFGLKTGSTTRAGLTFVAGAARDGRRLLAVVLGSQNHYAEARSLLDQGFALAAAGQATADVLPAVPPALAAGSTTTTTTTTTAPPPSEAAPVPGGDGEAAVPSAAGILRSAPPPAGAGDDRAGDVARRVVAVVVGAALALLGVGLVVAARRRLRPPPGAVPPGEVAPGEVRADEAAG